MKVAVLIGMKGSAYDTNAFGLKENFPEVDFEIVNANSVEKVRLGSFDKIVVLAWWTESVACAVRKALDAGLDPYKFVAVVGSHSHIRKGMATILRWYPNVCAVSNRLVAELNGFGIKSDFVAWFYDLAKFYPIPKKPGVFTFGWAGNCYRPVKRYHLFKAAAQVLLKDRKNYSAKLSALRIEADKDNCLECLSDLRQDEMPTFYRSLDCYVVTSEHEGQPKTAIEAALCGIPIVSSDVGVCRELGALILPEPLTVESLVVTIRRLRTHGKHVRDLANRGRANAEDIWNQYSVREKWESILGLKTA